MPGSSLGNMERPDVDKISGLSPVISIEQKTTNLNPRSTVGTITEIYDFLRLLFARASEAFSYVTGEKMIRLSDEQIVELIQKKFDGRKVLLLSPRSKHVKDITGNCSSNCSSRAISVSVPMAKCWN